MGYLIRGRIPDEQRESAQSRADRRLPPAAATARCAGRRRRSRCAALVLAATAWPVTQLGGEFMPPLDEGDLLYMPTALPGLSAGKASRAPAADRPDDRDGARGRSACSARSGRADTATDPAPLEMFETTIQFKPRASGAPA